MRNEFPSPSLRAAVAVAAFLAASCTAAGVRERIWRSGGDDDMTIHCLGNGSALFYGRGPEFAFVYGPGYSNPSFGEMKLESGARLEARTWRVDGRNEWRHEISSAGGVAEIADALDPEFDVLKRRIRTDIPLSFRFHTRPQAKLRWYKSYPCAGAARGVVMALVQVSTPYNCDLLATAEEVRMYILADGTARTVEGGVDVAPGEAEISVVLSRPPEMEKTLAFAVSGADVFARSAADWTRFFSRGAEVRSRIPAGHPFRREIEEMLFDIPALIRCQQARSGGVMAGHEYPMAYVRDQSGVLKGLLAMGYVDEAEKIVRFWNGKFRQYGNLVNAEVMSGHEGRMVFNDEVEVPAYVALSTFAVAEKRPGILRECREMLDWAVQVQLKQLHKGMTCFSGDETYVAGGFFPRSFLYHGSCESTALFILAAEKYVAAFGTDAALGAAASDARSRFRGNFVADGRVYANQPDRLEGLVFPRWQAGVCIRCDLNGGWGRLKSLEFDPASGLHVCPDCYGKGAPNRPAARRISLPCVSLLPELLDGGFVSRDEYERALDASSVDPSGATGYDFAVRLEAMRRCGRETSAELRQMLDARDGAGAWVEYYRGGKPSGCRCRPWESALNCAAILAAIPPVGGG